MRMKLGPAQLPGPGDESLVSSADRNASNNFHHYAIATKCKPGLDEFLSDARTYADRVEVLGLGTTHKNRGSRSLGGFA